MRHQAMIKESGQGVNWNTTVFMALFHAGALIAPFMFTWRALFVTISLWWVSGSLGVGMGFHRLSPVFCTRCRVPLEVEIR